MENKKIVVIVEDCAVRVVFGKGDLAGVSVEVIDLDRPAFVTPEEKALFDAMEERIDRMEEDSEWEVLY